MLSGLSLFSIYFIHLFQQGCSYNTFHIKRGRYLIAALNYLMFPAPVCHRPVGRSRCAGWHEDLKVPLVCHILTHFAWQLTNQSHQSVYSVCVFVCAHLHTLQRHLPSWSSPRGFQGLTSFALITATWDGADRLIFPTLHGAAQQQCLGTTRHPEWFYN